MTTAGKRNQKISFQRAVITRDIYNAEISTWEHLAAAWSEILWGTGQERREASQERASKTATFICLWSPTLNGVSATDRIIHSTGEYDITDVSPMSNREIHFTGVRSA